jgi:hypothetical protein
MSVPASIRLCASPDLIDFTGAGELLGMLNPTGASDAMTEVNLMQEVNSVQISLKTVASRWGISAQMEEIIGRLSMIPRQ